MNLSRLRLLGSGYTADECLLYSLDQCDPLDAASNFLSEESNKRVVRPALNSSAQQHVLEDKWVTQLFLHAVGVRMPPLVGFFHPCFGATLAGADLRTAEDVRAAIQPLLPCRLIFKPRGGRQGRNIIAADFCAAADGSLVVSAQGRDFKLCDFLQSLPDSAFKEYDGGYDGWLIQHFVNQHPFLLELAPYAVNTCRVVTFVAADGECKVHFAALRLGRRGSTVDNWDKGGLSVHIDLETGRLGRGVFKPRYGGNWVTAHPDSGALLVGRVLPMWNEVQALCMRGAAALSCVRSIGWDVALTPEGPVILEGNADWSLALIQVHTRGILTSSVRADFAEFGAVLPTHLPSPMGAIWRLFVRRWQRSRGPILLRRLAQVR